MIDTASEISGLLEAASTLVSVETARAKLRDAARVFKADEIAQKAVFERALLNVVRVDDTSPRPAPSSAEDDRFVATLRACCSEYVAHDRLDAACALLGAAYRQGDVAKLLSEEAFGFVCDAIFDELEGTTERAAMRYAEARLIEHEELAPPI